MNWWIIPAILVTVVTLVVGGAIGAPKANVFQGEHHAASVNETLVLVFLGATIVALALWALAC